MLSIQQIRDKLKAYNLTKVSRETGVSYNVVRNLANGNYKTCEYEAGRKLAEFLKGNE